MISKKRKEILEGRFFRLIGHATIMFDFRVSHVRATLSFPDP